MRAPEFHFFRGKRLEKQVKKCKNRQRKTDWVALEKQPIGIIKERGNYNMDFEKIQVFEEKKLKGFEINKKLSEYYKKIGKERKSKIIRECANFLMFKVYEGEQKERKLQRANFCKHPLCLMCSWRLSLKRHRELEEALKLIRQEDEKSRFYFLTLTVRNWKNINKDKVKRLQKQGVEFIRKVLKTNSYYVSLEITIGKDGNYHPHLHAVVHTEKYLSTTIDWIAMYRGAWGKIVGERKMDYQILTLYPIANGEEGEKNLHEVTKYILKPQMEISREMLINVSKSIENVKKGFSSGEIRKALLEAKKGLYERDKEELEKLEEKSWEIEFYKWVNNKYLLS